MPARDVIRLTDPRALRAYAHPTRMTLVGLLRLHGPFTATRAAELTGESVASCSYHLRMLAKYGLVEEAEGGQGREKPWQATARYTDWRDAAGDPAAAEAGTALSAAVAEQYFARMTRAIETRHLLPHAWREAEQFGDDILYLTPGELTELNAGISELVDAYSDRFEDASRRPEGAEPVALLRISFRDRRPRPEDGRRAAPADDPA
jgi:DNA-binding transcriptional ArsR family regulator